jgi:hypothetical protein
LDGAARALESGTTVRPKVNETSSSDSRSKTSMITDLSNSSPAVYRAAALPRRKARPVLPIGPRLSVVRT